MKMNKCQHCGQELEYYEDKQKYCVACFDLWNKGYSKAKEELGELFKNELEGDCFTYNSLYKLKSFLVFLKPKETKNE